MHMQDLLKPFRPLWFNINLKILKASCGKLESRWDTLGLETLYKLKLLKQHWHNYWMLSLLERAFYFIGSSVFVLHFYSVSAMWLPGIQLKWETTFRWNQMKPYTLEVLFRSSFSCPFTRPRYCAIWTSRSVLVIKEQKILEVQAHIPNWWKNPLKNTTHKKWNTALSCMEHFTNFCLLTQPFP